MRVYIEYALLDNLFFDWLLLFAVAKTMRISAPWWRLALGAVLGAAGAIIISLISAHWLWLCLLKTALLIFLMLASYPLKKPKKFFAASGLFLAYTFALGGSIIGLFYLLKIDFALSDTLNYVLKIPIGLIGLGAIFFCILVGQTVKIIKNTVKMKKYGCKIRLKACGQTFELMGFLDSGNGLTDNGTPVCFFSDCIAARQLKKCAAEKLLSGEAALKNLRYINYVTVDGRAKTLAFDADEFTIDGVKKKCVIAFGNNSCLNFDVLVNMALTEESV